MSATLERLLDLLAPLLEIHPGWALLALVFQLGNLVCRSFAWRNVLAAAFPDTALSAYRVGRAYAIGVALNGYLPARGGEAAKVALVRLQQPETNTVSVASSCSVVLLFDAIVGICLLALGWWSGALPAPPLQPLFDRFAASPPLVSVLAAAVAVSLGVLIIRQLGPRARRGWAQARQGVAVLRAPARYVRTVLSVQALAWCCRIAVVYCMLTAFGIAATIPLAALVVVVGGMSTFVPVPGGAGTQQVLAIFVLSAVATTSAALSYSIGMQVGVTLVNTTIGMIAAMLVFGRLHPLAALRQAAAAATLRPSIKPAG